MTDEVGLPGLSMRKLGAQLGVEAMSLYHYVENKADLLDAILDCLFQEVDLPYDVPDDDWETAIRGGLRAFHQVLVDHPAALEIFATRPARSANALKVVMWAHNRFTSVGLDPIQANHAFHFAVAFVMGHRASDLGAMAAQHREVDPEPAQADNPAVAEFNSRLRGISSADEFDAGLDAVVAGLRFGFNLP